MNIENLKELVTTITDKDNPERFNGDIDTFMDKYESIVNELKNIIVYLNKNEFNEMAYEGCNIIVNVVEAYTMFKMRDIYTEKETLVKAMTIPINYLIKFYNVLEAMNGHAVNPYTNKVL